MKNIIKILPIVLLTIAACNNKPQAETKPETPVDESRVQMTSAQMKTAAVLTGKLENKNIASVLKLSGSVDVPPSNIVSVSFPMGGYLKSAKLLPGMPVRKGEVIAVMEDPQFIQLQQDYLTAKAKLVYATSEFNRQQELNKSKAASDKVFQLAQSDYTVQRVLVRSLSEKLKLIGISPDKLSESHISRTANIYSPINGFITDVNVNIGKYVNPSDILFEIVNPADIHLALNVFEKDAAKLAIGQKVLAYSNNNPAKKYESRIVYIGREFSENNSIIVHCDFKESDKTLVPGMFMNGEIEVQANSAPALPAEAVVSFENAQYVFVERGSGEFEMVAVKTGNTENGYTEISFPDKKDYTNLAFVIKGAYSLLMKMKNTSDE